MNNKQETSKLYRQLAYKIGINPVRFSHRGYIARRIMKYIDTLEMKDFKEQLKYINVNSKGLKVIEGNQVYYI